MVRRRHPLTPEQLDEIREAARRGPDGKSFAETMRRTIEGTATAPEAPSAPEPLRPDRS